jgi:hypothetical protein
MRINMYAYQRIGHNQIPDRMKACRFRLVSDFSTHVLGVVEKNIGCISQKRIGYIIDTNEDALDNVLHHTAMTLRVALNVSVYKKENICKNSKAVIIAVYWSMIWVYLIFYRKNKQIRVIVMYRKKKMDGIHSVWKTFENI